MFSMKRWIKGDNTYNTSYISIFLDEKERYLYNNWLKIYDNDANSLLDIQFNSAKQSKIKRMYEVVKAIYKFIDEKNELKETKISYSINLSTNNVIEIVIRKGNKELEFIYYVTDQKNSHKEKIRERRVIGNSKEEFHKTLDVIREILGLFIEYVEVNHINKVEHANKGEKDVQEMRYHETHSVCY